MSELDYLYEEKEKFLDAMSQTDPGTEDYATLQKQYGEIVKRIETLEQKELENSDEFKKEKKKDKAYKRGLDIAGVVFPVIGKAVCDGVIKTVLMGMTLKADVTGKVSPTAINRMIRQLDHK